MRIDPLSDPLWAMLVDRAPNASIFHHPGWLGLLNDHYGYAMRAHVVLGDDGAPVAGLPVGLIDSRLTGRRLVALPFSDMCPPLDVGRPGAVDSLATAVLDEAEAEGLPLEVRGPLPGAPPDATGATFLHHVLALDDNPDKILRAARSQARRGVAKAARLGVVVERRTDGGALDEFYSLHARTRRRQGIPVQPKRFIRRFERLFIAGLGYVAVARHHERTVAAAVFLHHGPTLVYKYGASDERHLHLRPNNAIFADAISFGCETGLRELDFGRTDLDQEGLRAFKLGWGAEERGLTYTHVPPVARASQLAGRGRDVASAVIRRSPPTVGRVIGAALYRHFG